MLDQDVLGYLDKADLDDWRELQAEMMAMRDIDSGWSQKERESLYLREMVRQASFYDTYRLDKAKTFDFHPVTGAITESFITVRFEAEEEG